MPGDSEHPVTVWVMEIGCYDDTYVAGVYVSAEAAMKAHPPRVLPDDYRATARPGDAARPGGWRDEGEFGWSNGLDWGEAARCYPMEVQGEE